jgi:uncharacterized membrane protein
MSIYKVLTAVLVLSLAACADGPVDESHEVTIDQEIGVTPNCPAGQTVVFFTEPFGTCGGCTVSRTPGQPEQQFAACSGNINGTKKFIQTLCATPC